MHVHFLDPYRPLDSPVHRLDPRVKFVLTLAYIFTSALTPAGAWPAYILLFAGILSVEILSGLGVKYVHRRAILAVPFMLAALPLLFTFEGQALASFSLGAWTLILSLEGLERFASIAFKSWISVQAAIVLAASTSFPDLLTAMRAIRIPRLLVTLFGLMWRYLFVLVDEAMRLLRARAARSGVSASSDGDRLKVRPGGSLAWRARVAGGMAGSLFLRGFERSDRIYMAMVSRGYDGEIRAMPMPPVPAPAWVMLAGGSVVLLLLLLFGILFWG